MIPEHSPIRFRKRHILFDIFKERVSKTAFLGIYCLQVTIVGDEKASPVWKLLRRLYFPPLSGLPPYDRLFSGFECLGSGLPSSGHLSSGLLGSEHLGSSSLWVFPEFLPLALVLCPEADCWGPGQGCGAGWPGGRRGASPASALVARGRELRRGAECAGGPPCCRSSGRWGRRRRGRGEGVARWGRGEGPEQGRGAAGDVRRGAGGRESAGRACDEGQLGGGEQGGAQQGWLQPQ